jgi:hypothetical protein
VIVAGGHSAPASPHRVAIRALEADRRQPFFQATTRLAHFATSGKNADTLYATFNLTYGYHFTPLSGARVSANVAEVRTFAPWTETHVLLEILVCKTLVQKFIVLQFGADR